MAESAPVPAAPPNPVGPSHPTPVETELPPAGLNGSSALLAHTPMPAAPAEQPAPAESPSPAELVPAPTLRERLVWYFGAAALTCVLLAAGYRLDRADIRAPFYYDEDALLILPMVKATLDR